MIFSRPAHPDDLEQLLSFDQFHEITPEVLRSGNCIVAGIDGLVLGYLTVSRNFFSRRIVEFIFVHPDHRHCGLGNSLLEFAEKQEPTQALWISIALGNFNIQTLLHQRGYKHSGVVHDLAPVPELIYHKPPVQPAHADQ